MFHFNDASKAELLNIVQYALLALLPIVLLNKTMNRFVPEADDTKSSLELGLEVMLQISFLFVALFFVHRLVTFVPTYSGEKYAELRITNVILAVMTIVLSLQTKLGEKISILADRVAELWNGESGGSKKKKNGNGNNGTTGSGGIRVSQPIAGGGAGNVPGTGAGGMGMTPMQALPPPVMPDYNQMHQSDSTPLIGAASPGMEGFSGGPMPANAFGSPFDSGMGTGFM